MTPTAARLLLWSGFFFSLNACQQSVPSGLDNDLNPGRTSPIGPTGEPSKPFAPGGNSGDSPQKKVSTKECCTFPLAFIPSDFCGRPGDEKTFGVDRSGSTRSHAACDLLAPEGAPIYAVDDGIVLDYDLGFSEKTDALIVKHVNFTIRYGEVKKMAPGVSPGSNVVRGQLLTFVGRRISDEGIIRPRTMLHFERFTGEVTGNLTNLKKPPFYRRSDLVDPTPDLLLWEKDLPK